MNARERPYLLRRKRPFPKTVFAVIDRETGTDVGEIHNVTFRSPCVNYEGLLWLDEGDEEGTPGSRLVLTIDGGYRDQVAEQLWTQYVLRRDLQATQHSKSSAVSRRTTDRSV